MKKTLIIVGAAIILIVGVVVAFLLLRRTGSNAPTDGAPTTEWTPTISDAVPVPVTGPIDQLKEPAPPVPEFASNTDRPLTDEEKSQLGYPVAWNVRLRAEQIKEGKVFPTYVVIDQGTDKDGDGLDAAKERELGTNEILSDTDGDGVDDGGEVSMGTDALKPDTDGDGKNDSAELSAKGDPIDPKK